MSKQQELPKKIADVYYFSRDKILEYCNLTNLKIVIDLLNDDHADFPQLHNTLQLAINLADSEIFLQYLKTSNFHVNLFKLIKKPHYQERLATLYCQLIIRLLRDKDINKLFLAADIIPNELASLLNTPTSYAFYSALELVIQISSNNPFDFGITRNLTSQLINDLETQNEEPYLVIMFKYFFNFLASNYGQVKFSNFENTDKNRILWEVRKRMTC